MCGIAGIVSLNDGRVGPSLGQAQRMIGAMRHRGPDESGVYRDERAVLGHARLSIIDLATGQQPMSNENGSVWIVFNGEIFNYVELRRELTALGHRFRTESDTEVIVHAYESWGVDAFARFNGQWALALWDNTTHRLVLARDRVGVRPLFACLHAGRLHFASEVKAIFAADRSIPRRLDPAGLAEVFTFWTPVAPRTVFDSIFEIEPGHARIYEGGQVADICYWCPEFPHADRPGFCGDVEAAAAVTRRALERATALRMLRADVPVGSYLSGGLDSSLVAALALRAKGAQFATFSLRFEDAEYDESRYQHLMVERLGSEHHEVTVSRADIARVFPDVIAHAERPVLRTAPAPLYLLSKLVREAGIKVVLTGEGADEMFAGYDLFREGKVRRFWARQPHSEWRPLLLERLYPYLSRSPVAQQATARQFFGRNLASWRQPGFAHLTRWQTAAALHRLFSADMRETTGAFDPIGSLLGTLPADFGQWSFLAQDQYLEVRTLLSGYLLSAQGDRMLMAHSVEGRFPFLDREVIDLAQSLPASFKLRVLDEKHVLKRASRDVVPDEILRRKKQPYRAPDALSFIGRDAPDWIEEVMSESALSDAGVFDVRAARQVYLKCIRRGDAAQFSNSDNMALVGILSTQLLHQQFIATTPVVPPVSPTTVVDLVASGTGEA